MLIQHLGHAEFLIETEGGIRIVTDPFDASCGYPVSGVSADAALVSHQHHDHNAVHLLKGSPRVIDCEGTYTLAPDVRVTALKAWHDDVQGAKRGQTLLFLIEAEGLRIVHLGDLGDSLTPGQTEVLKKPDLLMIPVGGFFTIDAEKAWETARKLEAGTVLPMHYKTQFNADWPISGPEAFLNYYQADEIRRDVTLLRVTSGDLECQAKAVLFKAPSASGETDGKASI